MITLQQFTMVHAPAVSQRAALAALTGPQDSIERMVASSTTDDGSSSPD